jgi:hypothetical protein
VFLTSLMCDVHHMRVLGYAYGPSRL